MNIILTIVAFLCAFLCGLALSLKKKEKNAKENMPTLALFAVNLAAAVLLGSAETVISFSGETRIVMAILAIPTAILAEAPFFILGYGAGAPKEVFMFNPGKALNKYVSLVANIALWLFFFFIAFTCLELEEPSIIRRLLSALFCTAAFAAGPIIGLYAIVGMVGLFKKIGKPQE